MLTLSGQRTSQTNRAGITRRDMLHVGALGLGGLCLPDLLQARAAASASSSAKKTAVVFLWLEGGAPQTETFDPKPGIPEDYRSVVGETSTRLPGVAFGGLLPKLAQVANKLSVIRTLTHSDANHPGATHWMRTGYSMPAALSRNNDVKPDRPTVGSILARVRGATHSQTGVPTYIQTTAAAPRNYPFTFMWGPGFLGSACESFRADGKGYLQSMIPELPLERLNERRRLLEGLDGIQRHVDRHGVMEGMDDFQRQAFNVLVSGRVKEAFDLSREHVKTRARYGPGLGERLLLARRLCEAGAGFVAVNYGDWDMHGNFGPMTTSLKRMCPPFDHAATTFIEDVCERGLDGEILLLVAGEFGRSPLISGRPGGASFGREHWPELASAIVAGGGLKMGQVVGESTARAERPKSRPVSPQDLMATLFHVLGIDQELQLKDATGRPIAALESGGAHRRVTVADVLPQVGDGSDGQNGAAVSDDPELRFARPAKARRTIVLAHGAGAGMDSPFMTAFASGLADRAYRVARFEFPYMANARKTGTKRPPDRESVLCSTWLRVVEMLGRDGLVIGGKSMGGRIASMIADEARVAGLVCLGYPFHPVGKPDRLRIEHLRTIRTPTLILQGTRDPFGNQAEVNGYRLAPSIQVHWLEDGEHSFAPRKASGRTEQQNWQEAIEAIASFVEAQSPDPEARRSR